MNTSKYTSHEKEENKQWENKPFVLSFQTNYLKKNVDRTLLVPSENTTIPFLII